MATNELARGDTTISRGGSPDGLEAGIPNGARMYDYWLGGKDNFAADRKAAEEVIAISSTPGVLRDVREHRAFLGRAIRYCARAGIRQFLDIGTGLPTQENVHQVARGVIPDARVVYVDHDPVVCAHGLALLAVSAGVEFVEADVRRPEEILRHPKVTGSMDLDEPLALLLTGVLQHVTDAEDPYGLVVRLTRDLAPGSHLVLSHLSSEPGPDRVARAAEVFEGSTAALVPRSRAEIRRLFADFDLVDPGLVNAPAWRPDEGKAIADAEIFATLGGVARRSVA